MKTSKIVTALLALLGFTGCHIDIGGGRVEYGVPHAAFEIKGSVTDSEGEPLRDIKIVVTDGGEGRYEVELAVGITDGYGRYLVSGGWFGGSILSVSAEDIDGEKNGGEFAAQQRDLKIGKDDYRGGEGWNRGKVTKTADFTLTIKPQENEGE